MIPCIAFLIQRLLCDGIWKKLCNGDEAAPCLSHPFCYTLLYFSSVYVNVRGPWYLKKSNNTVLVWAICEMFLCWCILILCFLQRLYEWKFQEYISCRTRYNRNKCAFWLALMVAGSWKLLNTEQIGPGLSSALTKPYWHLFLCWFLVVVVSFASTYF